MFADTEDAFNNEINKLYLSTIYWGKIKKLEKTKSSIWNEHLAQEN